MENQPDPHREQSLEEAQHILQIFQKNSSSINMTPDLMNDMEKVNATVANFKEKTEQILNTIDQRLQNFSFPFNEEGKSEIYQKLSEQSKNIAMNVRSLQLALSNTKRKKRKMLLIPWRCSYSSFFQDGKIKKGKCLTYYWVHP